MLKYFDTRVCLISVCVCILDQFIVFFLNFQKCQAVLYYILIFKQMSKKVFCSKMLPP